MATIQTPTAVKAAAKLLSESCYNDEIRAIAAYELLRRMDPGDNDAVYTVWHRAWLAASDLKVAFDRQFQD